MAPMYLPFPISYHLPHPHPTYPLCSWEIAGLKPFPNMLCSSGPLHMLFQPLTMPPYLSLLGTIHRSYLIYPSSHAISLWGIFWPHQGTVLVITSASENSIQTPIAALSTLDYTLYLLDSLSHQTGRCGLGIHIWAWNILLFPVSSIYLGTQPIFTWLNDDQASERFYG